MLKEFLGTPSKKTEEMPRWYSRHTKALAPEESSLRRVQKTTEGTLRTSLNTEGTVKGSENAQGVLREEDKGTLSENW
eukprot:3187378-Amphidinium_carterae.1